jgi:hypothetical protein
MDFFFMLQKSWLEVDEINRLGIAQPSNVYGYKLRKIKYKKYADSYSPFFTSSD